MPNWCLNRVTVYSRPTSPDGEVEKFLKFVSSEDSCFDFNKIKPMPKEFDGIISGSTTINGQKVRLWRNTEEGSVPVSTKESDTLIEKYGANNWYDWCVENWGTKWPADFDAPDWPVKREYEGKIDTLIYEFHTAWGPPDPICEELRSMFPTLKIEWFFDEPGCEMAGYL